MRPDRSGVKGSAGLYRHYVCDRAW